MNRWATFFLKGVILLIGIVALSLCIFWAPEIASRDAEAHPETAYLQYPFLLSAYLLSAPFFIALYKAFKLLIYIDKNKAFSDFSVRALKVIKCSAITISALIVAGINLSLYIWKNGIIFDLCFKRNRNLCWCPPKACI